VSELAEHEVMSSELAQYLVAEYKRWGDIVRDSGYTPED
jgi:hypothetical protein